MINNTLLYWMSTACILILAFLEAGSCPLFDIDELKVFLKMVKHFYPLVMLKTAFEKYFNVPAFYSADRLLEI